MFDGIIDALSAAFTFMVIFLGVCIFIAIVMAMHSKQEFAEQNEQEENRKRELINTLIAESREASMELLLSNRQEVCRAINVLLDARRSGSLKIKEHVFIKIGSELGFIMDIETCDLVRRHLNSEIDRRHSQTR